MRVAVSAPTPSGAESADPAFWAGFGVALLAVAAAGWLARRRSRRSRGESGPETGMLRLARLVYSAAAFGASMALVLATENLLREGLSWRIAPRTTLAAFVFTLVGMLVFGIVHFWLGTAEPRRDRRWLVLALLAFPLVMAVCLAVVAGLDAQPSRILARLLAPVVAASAAAGLVWWAWLPPPRADVARRFE